MTESNPSAVESDGHLATAFAAQTVTLKACRIPLNAQGVSSGEPKTVLSELDTLSSPSISWDGSRLAFAARTADGQVIRLLDTRDGKAKTLTPVKGRNASHPVLSGDGEFVAYNGDLKNGYLWRVSGNDSTKICENCSVPTHVSFDGQTALFDSRSSADEAWVVAGKNPPRPLISWAGKPVLRQGGAHLSPDGKWVVFSGSHFDTDEKHLWIAPVAVKGPITETDLISLTNGDAAEIEPYWSPDGRTIYFLSNRDGFECVWARRVDLVTAKPQGAEFPVFHAHQAHLRIESPSSHAGDIGLSVGRDSLVVMMVERRGNIWLRQEARKR